VVEKDIPATNSKEKKNDKYSCNKFMSYVNSRRVVKLDASKNRAPRVKNMLF
jgi:hypothetical protein